MRILVYSRTTEYRHESIPAGIAALTALGRAHGFTVVATEDPAVLTPGELSAFTAVTFLSTSGEACGGSAGRAALDGYVRGGGAFVGIHSAAATEYDWPFYGELVGAWFDRHPEPQPGRILLRVDETSYRGGGTGADHPLAWCHDHLGGRSFYTALGHTVESYEEPAMLAHLLGGIRWATGSRPNS